MGGVSWYKLVVYIVPSAKRRAYFCQNIAIEMGGVSRYFSKVSGSGVGWILLRVVATNDIWFVLCAETSEPSVFYLLPPPSSMGVRKTGLSPKGWSLQMFACNQISFTKSFPAVLPLAEESYDFDIPGPQETGMRVHSPKPNFYKPPFCQKSFRNPNPYWSQRKCCSTPPICTAVRPPFVSLCLPGF